jgi:hypothetical protein
VLGAREEGDAGLPGDPRHRVDEPTVRRSDRLAQARDPGRASPRPRSGTRVMAHSGNERDLARWARLELATDDLENRCSIQLSYHRLQLHYTRMGPFFRKRKTPARSRARETHLS